MALDNVFAALSLFLATFMPSRRYAAITATAILVISYFGNNLAKIVELLSDIQFLFVFSYYDVNRVLEGNLNNAELLLMIALSTLFLALAIVSFQRRNVTVGAWPWQRGLVAVSSDGAFDNSSRTVAGD
jgi:ABC-2 type transport system permease protein